MSNGSHSLVSSRGLALALCMTGEIVLARFASAQFASAIDLSSRAAQPNAETWQSELAVSPFMRFDHRRVSVDGRWTAFGGEGQRLSGFGNLDATYYSPTLSGLQLSITGFTDRTLLNETFAVSRIGTDARLSYRTGSSGAWLGREISRDNKPTPISPVADYAVGGWHQWRSAILTLSVSSFGSREGARAASSHTETRPIGINQSTPSNLPDTGGRSSVRTLDTITVIDSGNAGRRRNWRDAQLGLHWSAGRVALQGLIGTRFSLTNTPNETWGQAQASIALAPSLAVIAAGGVHPSSAAYGIARSRFMELGVRISPNALRRPRLAVGVRPTVSAFEIENAENGRKTVRIRLPQARSVELSGDFTNWAPISLKRGDADQWETTLAISPGMHRLAIRIDGEAWTTPPGIAAVQDEFQGTVGVILVR